MFRLYSMLVELAVWGLLLPWQLLRLLTGRTTRSELMQQLGLTSPLRLPESPSLLIHAVSAGEMAAAEPLIRQLCALRPNLVLMLSAGNGAGLTAARRLQGRFGQIRAVALLPWDRHGAVQHWLKAVSPRAVVVVETEIWPNLFNECHRQGIPLAIVNGRIYPGDLGRYRLIRPFLRRVLARAALIGVQDESERRRFAAIGAAESKLAVLGNSKYDLESQGQDSPQGPPESTLLIVAGSTHAPEERWLLQTYGTLRRDFPDLRLVLAPREVRRARAVTRLARKAGWRTESNSADPPAQEGWDVWVVDRIGELFSWYAAADIVVVGGSLANRGGHNILEPATLGRPVVVGPHMEHFADVTERFLQLDALVQLPGPHAMEPALRRLLAEPALGQELGARARSCVEEGRGATRRYAQAVLGLIGS